jgi:hypothetical protein
MVYLGVSIFHNFRVNRVQFRRINNSKFQGKYKLIKAYSSVKILGYQSVHLGVLPSPKIRVKCIAYVDVRLF